MKGDLTTTTTITQETKDSQGNLRNRHTVTSEYLNHSEEVQVPLQDALLQTVKAWGGRTIEIGHNKNAGKPDKDL